MDRSIDLGRNGKKIGDGKEVLKRGVGFDGK